MVRTKASEKAKRDSDLGSMIIDPPVFRDDDDGDWAYRKKESPSNIKITIPWPNLLSTLFISWETQLFANLYRRVDEFMIQRLDCYQKLSLQHSVPGKGKKKKSKSIVQTLLEEENCDFEMFVKVWYNWI